MDKETRPLAVYIDKMGNEIYPGDFIVYPNGRASIQIGKVWSLWEVKNPYFDPKIKWSLEWEPEIKWMRQGTKKISTIKKLGDAFKVEVSPQFKYKNQEWLQSITDIILHREV